MQTLEVAIGLVFVYLMLSLVCTAAEALLVKGAIDAHAPKVSQVAAHASSELTAWNAAARAAQDAAPGSDWSRPHGMFTLAMDFADTRRSDPSCLPGVIVLRPRNQSTTTVVQRLDAMVRAMA